MADNSAQPHPAAQPGRPLIKSEANPFIIEETFPDPLAGLKTFYKPLPEIKDSCLYALDANVMLAVYALKTVKQVDDVRKHFRQLVRDDRLFVPEQAVREFLRHRSKYIAQAVDELEKLTSAFPKEPSLEHALFAALPEYVKAARETVALGESIERYKAATKALVAAGRNISNNDEVSRFYAELFTSAQVVHHGLSKNELLKDLAHRTLHNLPPGTKDAHKADGGVGDVAIWHSLLKLARDRRRDVIFVTHDGKVDWVVTADKDKAPFAPRLELVAEFQRVTGQQFGLVRLTEFLGLIGSSAETVAAAQRISSANAGGTRELTRPEFRQFLNEFSTFETLARPVIDFLLHAEHPMLGYSEMVGLSQAAYALGKWADRADPGLAEQIRRVVHRTDDMIGAGGAARLPPDEDEAILRAARERARDAARTLKATLEDFLPF